MPGSESEPLVAIFDAGRVYAYHCFTRPADNFMSSHADGGLILWDKDREDPSSFLIPSSPPPVHLPVSLHLTPGSPEADNGPSHPDGGPFEHGHLYEDMVVTRQPHQLDRKGSGKYNPISHWKVSRKAVTGEI